MLFIYLFLAKAVTAVLTENFNRATFWCYFFLKGRYCSTDLKLQSPHLLVLFFFQRQILQYWLKTSIAPPSGVISFQQRQTLQYWLKTSIAPPSGVISFRQKQTLQYWLKTSIAPPPGVIIIFFFLAKADTEIPNENFNRATMWCYSELPSDTYLTTIEQMLGILFRGFSWLIWLMFCNSTHFLNVPRHSHFE